MPLAQPAAPSRRRASGRGREEPNITDTSLQALATALAGRNDGRRRRLTLFHPTPTLALAHGVYVSEL